MFIGGGTYARAQYVQPDFSRQCGLCAAAVCLVWENVAVKGFTSGKENRALYIYSSPANKNHKARYSM